jgi:hypothetical protein
MSRFYGGIAEITLRDAVPGAARGTNERAIAELFDEVDELRDALRLVAHRAPWDDDELCWCSRTPFDDGRTGDWKHEPRCTEIQELLDI